MLHCACAQLLRLSDPLSLQIFGATEGVLMRILQPDPQPPNKPLFGSLTSAYRNVAEVFGLK